jgi:hypothetical protein
MTGYIDQQDAPTMEWPVKVLRICRGRVVYV